MYLPFLWPSQALRPMTRLSTIFTATSRRAFSSTPSRSQERDYYLTLSLPRNATKGQVKRRFYELSKLHHPDINPNDGEAARKFLEISEAYNVLGNDFTRRDYDRRTNPPSSGTTSPAGFRRHASNHLRTKEAVHARPAAYDRLSRDREHPTGPSAYWPGRASASYGNGNGPLHGNRPPHRNANPSYSHPSAASSSRSRPSSMAEAPPAVGTTKANPKEVRTFRTGWNPEPHKYGSDREYTVSKERRLLWAIIGFGAIVQGVWLLRLAVKH